MLRKRRIVGLAALASVAGIVLAACGGGSSGGGTTSPSATAATTVQSGGTMTYALDENLVGFNVNTSAASEFVLQEIMNVVWPQSYIIDPGFVPQLNTELLDSVTETSTDPQTLVYKINPKAVWSDGVSIDAADYIYNWQAQSGSSKYKDVGGKPFDAASSTGYNQIKSVTGSDPTGGTCNPGSASTYTKGLCPNGKTVTVVFAKPFPDYKALFGDIVPAHIAQKVGWNTGFNNYKNAISGSWYQISRYTPNQSVVLTKNPRYWGTPGNLDRIVFRILSSDDSEPPALANGDVNFLTPEAVTTAFVQQVAKIPNTTVKVEPGLEFEHLDFNEANPYLAKVQVRQAIAYGTDRKQIIQRTAGEIDPSIVPLGNRMFVNSQPQYVDNGAAYDTVNVAKAKSLLSGLGFTMGSDGYYQPNYGPEKGKDLSLTITTTTGNPTRSQTEQLFQSQMKAIGIKINIHNEDAETYFGTSLPKGQYDIGEFAWVATPFVSSNQSIYCSYTNAANCGQNWIHYANKSVDTDMANGATAPSADQEAADFNAADKQLWADMATLPIYQYPVYFAWDNNYANVEPNASSTGASWNAEQWGLANKAK
ncbi:MAG TPA: ABC transporter family substrate-binding protein [Mycobacteriales bacterium]|nr:ABC transporter family substrate-binding protein [Mycobacteriales bacterium]